MGFVFLVGGARSGKSHLASRLADDSGRAVTYVATATAGDAEMEERIRSHRSTRPPDWSTVEEPLELLAAVRTSPPESFLVIDCLTLWVTNLMGAGRTPGEIRALAASVAHELGGRRGVVVSNEVGLGIVPLNELARAFRDTLGAVNAAFAERAERSFLMVAGRALELSSTQGLQPR
jgi:adenosyl cobinamide kinase/adenosyl cobinamide phosphate guanylyltransferase